MILGKKPCKSRKAISNKDVEHLAKLSALEVSEEEISDLSGQLSDTVDYVENLEELETKDVDATSTTISQKNVSFEDGRKNVRGFTQEEAVSNAKLKKDGLFLSKRVINQE